MNGLKKILFFAIILAVIMGSVKAAAAPQSCGLVPSSISQQITTNEPWYCPINQQIYGQWLNVLPIALVVVLISFMIAGIIFMTGVAFNNNRIRNFGMTEFYEAIATAIIVAAFLYICAVMFGVLPGVFVERINPFATSFQLITTTIQQAENLFTSIYNLYVPLSALSTVTVGLTIAGQSIPVTQAVFSTISALLTVFFLDPAVAISRFLVDGILILYAEYYLLSFFAVAAIPAFLIPGVLFRSIFPTRAIGGILIAFAIGFYLVMPTLFSVAYSFTAPTVQANMQLAASQLNRFQASNGAYPTSSSSPLVLQLNNVKSSLNGFWLLIFFYPALIIAITYAVIVEISNLIGGVRGRIGGSFRRFI
jgi:hypothetical protein